MPLERTEDTHLIGARFALRLSPSCGLGRAEGGVQRRARGGRRAEEGVQRGGVQGAEMGVQGAEGPPTSARTVRLVTPTCWCFGLVHEIEESMK